MHELITMIVRALVDDPEQVTVHRVEGERSIIFEVRVAPDDLGRVIGKGGRIPAPSRPERAGVWPAGMGEER